MHQKPLLSIILTFHNRRFDVEPTLAALYGLTSIPFEVFVMEDGSTDGGSDAIQSLLDYYQHEHTYYFEHSENAGRGNCLNEALLQCNGSVLWMPESIDSLDENRLQESIRQLRDSGYPYICDEELHLLSNEDPITLLRDSTHWPADGCFLWSLERIPSVKRFFNPFMPHHHGLELAVRLGLETPGQRVGPWHSAPDRGAASPNSPGARSELACSMLRSGRLNDDQQTLALEIVKELSATTLPETEPTPLSVQLDEAHRMKQEGRFSSALELVERILTAHPGHQQAKQLKIEILERKRRFVEASELKHELSTSEKAQKPLPPDGKIKTSIVVPTALYGQAALEHCLISLAEHCNPDTTELVVIDNASLDDTHDYLSELREKGFFRCTVITNKQNAGFAASVNQGLEKARGEFACILHNDVELTDDALHQLERLMEAHADYALIGPLTRNTLNPAQSLEEQSGKTDGLQEAEYLDSFCMMLRMDTNLRMDEAYRLAFFEDVDLCFQARAHGLKVGVATGVLVEHHFGTTTYAMNLDTDSEAYWKNVSYFNEKWSIGTYSEEELKSHSRFDQLLTMDAIVNPVYPEDELVGYFNRLFTDEVKTEILKSEHDSEILCRLVHLMMVMDQREVMRRLEDRLDDVELPASLAHRLIRFYFNRNIYSRCTHYLDRLTSSQGALQSELYKLEILVNEKELDAAVPMLRDLLERAPSNPRLYKLAGDIHRFEGNEEEALSFYRIAHQINPFEYSPEGVEELRLKS